MGNYSVCLFFRRTFKIFEMAPPDDVKIAFKEYTGGKRHMTAEQLQKFLKEFQGEAEITLEKAEQIMKKAVQNRHHLTNIVRHTLSLDDFHHYLFSADLNPPIRAEVHHDMNAPLSHYFIFTGHNSYLTGNQLTSPCSDVPIIKALEKGVRVVELDLWPKSDEEVHVLHGGTPTTPVELIKCLESIKNNAFKENPYPVIITLEDHLTPKLQKKVAQMLRDTFGDMLFLPKCECLEELPSPDNLRYKIIISTKPPEKLNKVSSVKEENNNSQSGKGWKLWSQLSLPLPLSFKRGGQELRRAKSDLPIDEDKIDDKISESSQEDEDDDSFENGSVPSKEPEYKDLIGIHAGKPKGKSNDAALKVEPNKVRRLSLSEEKLKSVAESHGMVAVRFTQKNILRIYPKGTRVFSSNYDPLLGWMHGAQMVAFNMQGKDRHLWLMQGMFRANGECGYFKKPDILMNTGLDDKVFDPKVTLPVKKILKVKVYMGDGWDLDFGRTDFDLYSPPDFYTRLSIEGVAADKGQQIDRTKTETDKWSPVWNQEFTFKLTVPELALLRVDVYDADDMSEKGDFAGQTCLPVSELKPGIRAVPLFDKKGRQYKHVRLLMRFEFV